MLFHLSIDADDPQRVATVLAELWGGQATPFPPVAQGSWLAHSGDDRNTMVEVYPRGTELVATDEGAIGVPGTQRRANPVHFAMATALDKQAVLAIARREGWPAEHHMRGGGAFGVIEIWVEGCQMVEVLTPEMQREYLDTITLENWRKLIESDAFAEEIARAA